MEYKRRFLVTYRLKHLVQSWEDVPRGVHQSLHTGSHCKKNINSSQVCKYKCLTSVSQTLSSTHNNTTSGTTKEKASPTNTVRRLRHNTAIQTRHSRNTKVIRNTLTQVSANNTTLLTVTLTKVCVTTNVYTDKYNQEHDYITKLMKKVVLGSTFEK